MIRCTALGLVVCIAGCHSSAPAPVAPVGGSPAIPRAASAAPSAASELLRYRPPSCVLRYEVRATLTPARAHPVETWTSFEATSAPAGMTIATTSRRIFPPNGAQMRSYPHELPPSAPIGIAFGDGVHVAEQGGPSQVYDGIPQHTSGLSILFPDLPDASAPGSDREWRLAVPRSQDMVARVRVDSWSNIGGVRAATLTMVGSQQLATHLVHMTGGPETAQHTVTPGSATLTGTYVVLASGRVLRATVDRASVIGTLPPIERTSASTGAPPAPATTSQTEHIEARLVSACDGPTDPPFEPSFSPREAATMAAGDFVTAWQKGAREPALSLLAPELRQQQGDDALWKKLATFIDVQGPHAVEPPHQLGANDVTSEGEAINVVVRGAPRTDQPPGAPVRLTTFASPTTLTMVRRGDKFVVLRIHTERSPKIGAPAPATKEVLLDVR